MKRILVTATVLAVVAAFAAPIAVYAGVPTGTGATDISGTVPVVIEVDAPASAALGTLSVSAPVSLGSPITVTVKSTDPKWTLGASADDAGLMYTSDVPALKLANALKIQGGDLGTAWTSLSAPVTVKTATASVGQTDIADVNFQQSIGYGDTAGKYTINVTFTGTPN
jgi:hypothetical protein